MQTSQRKKEEFSKALGLVIKELHTKSNRSARSIAYEVDISKTTLLLAERGLLDPQISTFCKLAEAFYLTPNELLKKVYLKLPAQWCFIEDNSD